MSYTRIIDLFPYFDSNGDPASGYYVQAYEEGQTPGSGTVVSLATDSSGSNPQTSVQLNSKGVPEVSGNEVNLYINQNYKLAIYPTDPDPAYNGAAWGPIDGIKAGGFTRTFATVSDMKLATGVGSSDIVQTLEHTSGYGIEGGNSYYARSVTAGSDDGGSLIKSTGSPGIEFVGMFLNGPNIMAFGASPVISDNSTAIQNAFNYIDLVKGAIEINAKKFDISNPVSCVGIDVKIFGYGRQSQITSNLSVASPALYIGDGVSAIRGSLLEDFRVIGSGSSSESVLVQANECLEGKAIRLHCELGANDGFLNSGGEGYHISDGTYRDNGRYGIRHANSDDTLTSAPLLRCEKNLIKDNGDTGIRLEAAAGHIVRGNIIEGHNSGTGGDDAGIYCNTASTRFLDNKFETNTENIIIGDVSSGSRPSGVILERNRFSGGLLNFTKYSNFIASRNIFENSASVNFGADEGNKYSIFDENIINKSFITNNATPGKIVISRNIEGTTSDLQETFSDGDTTPNVSGVTVFKTNNSSPTTITNFDDGYTGQVIAIEFGDANTTLDHGSGFILLSTKADMTPVANSILILEAISGTGGTSEPQWKDIGYWPPNGTTSASSGTITIKSGSANSVDSTGFYEVAPNIWVPYVSDPTP